MRWSVPFNAKQRRARKGRLDPDQPRAVGRQEDQFDVVISRSGADLGVPVRGEVVQHDVQLLPGPALALADPVVARRVAIRVGRREVITRDQPAEFVAFIGGAALRQIIGSRELLSAQLRHLLQMARRPNVDLRGLRHDSGSHPALEGPSHLIETEDSTVVLLEMRNSALFLHEPQDVSSYRQAAARVLGAAMSPTGSAKLIEHIAESAEGSRDP
ncbi:DUF5753 domain-containing protein [Saccharopolyspora hirsuta]|uniref:DUF5753 domain-containing protein n=1 Tax=Saccharopolyspora hirsuta TaxID=1837 RepID=UPI00331DEE69